MLSGGLRSHGKRIGKFPLWEIFFFHFFSLVHSFLVSAEVYSRVSHMLKVVGYYRARERSKANSRIR